MKQANSATLCILLYNTSIYYIIFLHYAKYKFPNFMNTILSHIFDSFTNLKTDVVMTLCQLLQTILN